MNLNGFRAHVKSVLLRIAGHHSPPVILTEFGPVTEAARLRAALNMRNDPAVRQRVEELLAKQYGSLAKGIAEARRRYPEGYETNDDEVPE